MNVKAFHAVMVEHALTLLMDITVYVQKDTTTLTVKMVKLIEPRFWCG